MEYKTSSRVNFRLNSKKSKQSESATITVHMSMGPVENPNTGKVSYGRCDMSTGIRIRPVRWDQNRQRVKDTGLRAFEQSATELNLELRRIEEDLLKAKEFVQVDDTQMSQSAIRAKYEEILSSRKRQEYTMVQTTDVLEVFQQYLEWAKSTMKPSSLKSYWSSYRSFERYYEQTSRPRDFLSIDRGMKDEYDRFLLSDMPNKPAVCDSTVNKRWKHIRTFLQWSFDREYKVNEQFRLFKSIRQKASQPVITLSEREYQDLKDLNLRENQQELRRVRDLFVFGVEVGQRYSDFIKMNRDAIIQKEGIPMHPLRQQKTNKLVEVPMSPTAISILKRYGGIPPQMSQQSFNRLVKRVCLLAGINAEVESVTQSSGQVKSEMVPKYRLITSHCARRTFATRMYYTKQQPSQQIKIITGHTSESSFLKYIGERSAPAIAGIAKAMLE